MKILHLIKNCNFACGNVHAAIDLACEQANQGYEVFFVSSGGHHENILKENNVNSITLEETSINPFKVIFIFLNFISILKRIKPDVIHAHMMSSAILGWFAGRILGIPLVTTVHNSFDKHSFIMSLGDRVIAVSKSVANEMNKKGISINKIRVVLNGTLGVVRRRKATQNENSIQLKRPSIVTICGLHPRKGVNFLIEAFNLAQNNLSQDCHLYIVGAGPNENEYKQQSINLNNNRIHFTGALEDTVSILNQTDIFILASLAEPAGLVISEAREAGAAIIASNVGGIPEMLDNGEAGILFDAKNVEQISESIVELISDKDKLNFYKDKAKKNIEKFHISRVANETNLVYQELIKYKY